MEDFAQFALPEEERKRLLLSNLMMGLGAGLLDSRGKNVWPAISTGLLGGMQMGQQAIMGAQKLRGDSITQALNAAKLKRESELQDYISRELRGDPAPAAGAFPTPGPVANQFGPAPVGESAPTTKRTLLQKAETLGVGDAVRMAIASGGPEGLRKAAEIIANASKPNTVSPGQSVYDPTGKMLYSAPNIGPGMQADGGVVGTMPGYEDTIRAIEAAKAAGAIGPTIVEKPSPVQGEPGRVIKGTYADLYGPGSSPGFTSPGAVEQQKKGIETAAAKEQSGNAAMIDVSKNQLEEYRKSAQAATTMANHVANVEKVDKGEIFSGPGGAIAATAANWFNSLVPGANISGAKLADTQFVKSEISKMQQALGKAFPGQQSNYELQVVTESLPTLMLTPDGRQRIYAAVKQAAAYEQSKYSAAAQHALSNNGVLLNFAPPGLPPIEQFQSGLSEGPLRIKMTPAGSKNTTAQVALEAAIRANDRKAIEELRRKGWVQ